MHKQLLSMLSIMILALAIIPSFVYCTSSVDLPDWQSSDHGARMKITLTSDSYISADATDVPILLKFEGAGNVFWANRGDDDGDDARFYSTDSSGVVCELDYEVIDFNATAYRYHVFVNMEYLEDGSDTGNAIYLYTDYDGAGDFDSPIDVWGTTAKYIGHFITNADDSSANGNDGVVTDATLTTNSSYLGGACYSFDGDNDKITLPQGLLGGLTTFTLVTQVYADPTCANNGRVFDYGTAPWASGVYCISYLTSGTKLSATGYDTTYRSSNTGAISGKSIFASVYEKNSKNYVFLNGSKTTGTTADATMSADEVTLIGLISDNSGDFKGRIGFSWIFSDVKSDDWIKAVYNNQENYSSFVTVGTIETPPTFDFLEGYPTRARFSTFVDARCTITAPDDWLYEEVNVSYYVPSEWYSIGSCISSTDSMVATWDPALLSLVIPSNSWSEQSGYMIKYDFYDGVTWHEATSSTFTIGSPISEGGSTGGSTQTYTTPPPSDVILDETPTPPPSEVSTPQQSPQKTTPIDTVLSDAKNVVEKIKVLVEQGLFHGSSKEPLIEPVTTEAESEFNRIIKDMSEDWDAFWSDVNIFIGDVKEVLGC